MVPERLLRQLENRAQKGILRQLQTPAPGLVDFCSNDYLGLASSPRLTQLVEAELAGNHLHGATGSRLLSGNSVYAQELEAALAHFHHAEAALLFNSGYAANVGFFSSVPQRGDTILYDEASHASMKDGIRLSFAQSFAFRHNDLEDLQTKLKRAQGDVYVAVESLYSMDGDVAPLQELAELCQEKGLYLVVDEAHSNGIYGPKGEGLVVELGLKEQVFARIMTFGKALGSHGAAVVGPKALQEFLLNFSRAFIYTTALPLASLATIKAAYHLLPSLHQERAHLQELAKAYHTFTQEAAVFSLFSGKQTKNGPIQTWHLPGVKALKQLSFTLQEAGFDARPILSPTVPAGTERLRLVLHAFNTQEQLQQLCSLLLQHSPSVIL
ncbi:aminotransferase class I/II-fold pyridoxal phosphate-dependent enzyme [Nibribacter ruber]|uniref:Aminotransferase class I/II-fold pyridoxal phosphate-dependent enzyme n=1 Tax=Nibribacter ruber TaxID=2698458 RepID=A0A6P1NS77_9BACT|nr:8-amino-7-oxononanoate synthase [Nibribacter ruber]QHL86686.1 aminotransferase class I/II-fold pyridoxal phosphate-dependent enzyme [Nibribacter ruber]